MNKNSSRIEWYALPLFIILTPLLSILMALYLPLPSFVVVLIAASFPALLAILLTAMADGKKGVAALLQKLIQWRIGFKWYVVALGLPLGIHLAIGLLAFLLGWTSTIQIRPWSLAQLALGLLILILSALEELGWRGYALPRLLAHRSALFSALLIGIFWGALHVGLGIMEDRALIPTFLAPFGFSVVVTWLFIHTRRSLVGVTLCHFGFNYFVIFEGGLTLAQILWLEAVVTLALAFILIIFFGTDLQRSPVKKQPTVGTRTELN